MGNPSNITQSWGGGGRKKGRLYVSAKEIKTVFVPEDIRYWNSIIETEYI
jgi:hypothetical protein